MRADDIFIDAFGFWIHRSPALIVHLQRGPRVSFAFSLNDYIVRRAALCDGLVGFIDEYRSALTRACEVRGPSRPIARILLIERGSSGTALNAFG